MEQLVSKLAVNGNQSIGSSYFSYAAPADSLIVQGRVGIGTTNPNQKLDVSCDYCINWF